MIGVKTTENIVEEALKKSKKLREAYLKSRWKIVVGDELVNRCSVDKIDENLLYIITDTSSLANYLLLESENIKKKVNTLLKEDYIDNVRIKTGSIRKK